MDVHLFFISTQFESLRKDDLTGQRVPSFSFLFLVIFSVIYLWLCWVFVCHEQALSSFSERGLLSSFGVQASLVVDTRSRPLGCHTCSTRALVAPLRSCGIFPEQGSNPCALLWQVDSYPLCHQGRLFLSTCIINQLC